VRNIFADSSYWIALLNPDDYLHDKACQLSAEKSWVLTVTSEMVLTEVMNHFSASRASLRRAAAAAVKDICDDANCRVIPQTSDQFRNAVRLFEQRDDKQWSLTDCASILIMQAEGIHEALTHDTHFTQAGFTALLRGVQ
jgi:predicted nucleic acid-binding protein